MPTFTDISTLITPSTGRDKERSMITGTKTSVSRVVVIYKQGASAEEIARRLSHLSLAQVYAALAYYHSNQEEIESELAESDAEYWNLVKLHSSQA